MNYIPENESPSPLGISPKSRIALGSILAAFSLVGASRDSHEEKGMSQVDASEPNPISAPVDQSANNDIGFEIADKPHEKIDESAIFQEVGPKYIGVVASTDRTEFGFNTHLQKTENGEWDVDKFKNEINFLVENNQNWVRFNIDDSINLPPRNEGELFHFEESGIDAYEEAVAYAHEKGIDIVLVTNIPGFARDYSPEDYEKIAHVYYKELAKRFKGSVDVWQIFNEADRHHFRDYQSLYSDSDSNENKIPSEQYFTELETIVQIAGSAIKSVDSETKIAINVSGWPVNDEMQQRWESFLDNLYDSVDELILDFYPDANIEEIDKLSQRIQAIKDRYTMHVSIGEFGMCTGDGRFSEDDQVEFVRLMIRKIKEGKPAVVMLYELSDEEHKDGCEGSFGVLNVDGTMKSSAEEILSAMK